MSTKDERVRKVIDAIRTREDAKRPKETHGRKAVKADTSGQALEGEPAVPAAEDASEEVVVPE